MIKYKYIYKTARSYMVRVVGIYVGCYKSIDKALEARNNFMKETGIGTTKRGEM